MPAKASTTTASIATPKAASTPKAAATTRKRQGFAAKLRKLVLSELQSRRDIGRTLNLARLTFPEKDGREAFLLWASDVTGKSAASVEQYMLAATVLDSGKLSAAAENYSVEVLASFGRVPESKLAAVVKSAGKNPTTTTVREARAKHVPKSIGSKKKAADKQEAAIVKLVKGSFGGEVRTLLRTNLSPSVAMIEGAKLGAKHGDIAHKVILRIAEEKAAKDAAADARKAAKAAAAA